MNLSERYSLMVDSLRLNANRIWLVFCREGPVERVKRGQYRCKPANATPALAPRQSPETVI